MSEWKTRTRKGKTRLVYQTDTHTATVRSARDGQWLWTVHTRGESDPRFPTPHTLAHGKCEGQEVKHAALSALGRFDLPAEERP